MTADEVKHLLQLEPHPREGGWFIQTYASAESIHLPRYRAPRHIATAIYYLLETGTFSEMHRLASDELFHFYAGDAVEMLQLLPNGIGQLITIGPDLRAGERPQVLVERGIWQGSRLRPGGSWALLGCTVSPGFEYADYESGDRASLGAEWPSRWTLIEQLTRPEQLARSANP